MKRAGTPLAAVFVACIASTTHAATLERMSLDDMIQKSSEIVRGRISATPARVAPTRGGIIYTHYTLDVAERWKGSGGPVIDVAVPGGVAQGFRQTFPGSPLLDPKTEYVFFLWTSRSGLTQIIGLSQGLLTLGTDPSGKATLGRSRSTEPMVDSLGNTVTDPGFSLTLSEFRTAIRNRLGGAEK